MLNSPSLLSAEWKRTGFAESHDGSAIVCKFSSCQEQSVQACKLALTATEDQMKARGRLNILAKQMKEEPMALQDVDHDAAEIEAQ